MHVPSGSASTTWLSQILSNSVRGFASDIVRIPLFGRLFGGGWLGGHRRLAGGAAAARALGDAGGLARPAPQVIQLRAPNVAAADDRDLGYHGRIERKH